MDVAGGVKFYFFFEKNDGFAKIDAPVTDTTVDKSVNIVRITESHAYTVHDPYTMQFRTYIAKRVENVIGTMDAISRG